MKFFLKPFLFFVVFFIFAPVLCAKPNVLPIEINARKINEGLDLTQSETSLWARIRHGFAMQDIDDELTTKYQNLYENNPAYLKRMVARAKPFLHRIVEEIEKRNLPTELALLPMVESAFNPKAYSRAKASGLWQFIPSTGKRFRLEQNYFVDERRDVLASTEAALEYLQNIYDLHGDWHLALASYNWGEGAVGRAIRKNEHQDLASDYLSLKMPNETRHYVPKLQALKNIFGNPFLLERLGIEDIPNRSYVASVQLKDSISVQTAAALAGLSEDELLKFNPAHNRALMFANTELLLPEDKIDEFEENLENFEGPLHNLWVIQLKTASTLSDFAKKHHLSLEKLAQTNGLNPKSSLKAGSALLVPQSVAGAQNLDDFVAEHGMPEMLEKKVAQKRKWQKRKKPSAKRVKKKTKSKKSVSKSSKKSVSKTIKKSNSK